MKLWLRFLTALYAGFLFTSAFVFIWGDAGLIRMKALRDHRDRLRQNTEALAEIHDELTLEKNLLLYDELEVELRARTFGYHREQEIPVKLPISKESSNSRVLGTLIRQIPTASPNTLPYRVIALCISITVFACTFIWRKHGHSSRQQ